MGIDVPDYEVMEQEIASFWNFLNMCEDPELQMHRFCTAVIEQLEGQWLCMVRRNDMPDHVREFFAVTGFPQAVGALDGCHFPVSPPKEHATDYYNYKGWYSIILLALVDHRYRFRYIRVGSPGRCHDASVYADSELKNLVESAHFKTPHAIIEGTSVAPVILCDQAFPLTQNLMKPYANPQDGTPQQVFNYNLSRTRRIVENAFGRMKARFRFVAKRTECRLPNSRKAIRACCILHNICEEFRDNVEQPWEQEAQQLAALYVQPFHNTQAHTEVGEETRTAFAKYFSKRAPHSLGASSDV
ncbi:putative nuclease HARBI1 [Dermacentor silvarum]|uniref:putative nuclease HARBI1 n=1 Tax=Dermacentor silvarum TaxID=543639 RepID=UPI0021018A96|nr:putative nuclease HARBI1 [Dermacentor silvarum]